jgi:hypothetical protein
MLEVMMETQAEPAKPLDLSRMELLEIAVEIGMRTVGMEASTPLLDAAIESYINNTEDFELPPVISPKLKAYLENKGYEIVTTTDTTKEHLTSQGDAPREVPPVEPEGDVKDTPKRHHTKRKKRLGRKPGKSSAQERRSSHARAVAKKAEAKTLRVPRAILTPEQVEQINSYLGRWISVRLRPLAEGSVQIIPGRKTSSSPAFHGRMPVIYTAEEQVAVDAEREKIRGWSLEQMLERLREIPLPPQQAKGFPAGSQPTVFDLYRDQRVDPTGRKTKCHLRICKMRATTLLLRAAASRVSGRKIYY